LDNWTIELRMSSIEVECQWRLNRGQNGNAIKIKDVPVPDCRKRWLQKERKRGPSGWHSISLAF